MGFGKFLRIAIKTGMVATCPTLAVGMAILNSEDKEKAKKEGYNKASKEYEEKLRGQAEEFLSQKRDFQTDKEAYEKLIESYKVIINELKNKANKSEEEIEKLGGMEKDYNKLLSLPR